MSNKIGRFEILSEITHSDISSVYKASDPESKRTIALKTMNLQTLGEQAAALVQSVLAEAEGSKVLNSHNIALLYGAGEMDGLLCASMEYVQGNSVATMLARKEGFSIWDLQDIARQSCQGLDHAHVRKVVHHSLEPAKIMVQWDGIVKILGFGISSTGDFAAKTTGNLPEVLHYMAPEQVKGEPLDARSNIFSLGAVLYEMVTERKAFSGDNADQVRQAILEMTPVAVDQINRKVHPALSAVIKKALSKAPEERYQSGQELVNDLEKCKESPAKPAVQVAPKPVAKPAVPQVKAQPPQSKAAAAGQGATIGSQTTSTPQGMKPPSKSGMPAGGPALEAVSTEQVNMSAAVSDEPEVQSPKINVDPMMDESRQAGTGGRSFSEIDELPPLKEVYVAPAPPPPVEEPLVGDPVKAAVFHGATSVEKPKVQPREVAKKAVNEIKQTPPQLYMYAIGAAVAVVLLVVAGIAYHIHSQDSDDDNAPAQTQTAAPKAVVPAPVPASPAPPVEQAAAPVQAPAQVTPEAPAEESPAIAEAPKANSKNKKKAKAPVAPAIIPGRLNVDSSPQGAQIAIDGQNAGAMTPFNIANLMPGHHTVTISKAGFASETRAIDVSSGSKSVISVQLAPLTGSVSVLSSPLGAAVWMDGKDTGLVTPAVVSVDKPGTHSLVFKKQGYLDETASANVQIGQTLQIAPTLRALGSTDDIKIGGKFKKMFGGSETAGMGTVNVKTQPKGAQVAVNNRIVDKMSPVEFYLNPGNYVIDITMSGFKGIHKVIAVEKNGKVVIDESLDRE
jgi:eukaryotic-like serine/threonine-protein kinase